MTAQKKVLTTFISALMLVVCALSAQAVLAQDFSSGLAVSVPVLDANAQDGDIITSAPQKNGFVRATIPYDPLMYGVITDTPALALQVQDLPKGHRLALSTGKALVRVTTANGAIKKGDYITSSTTAGVGQKIEKNGYVIGSATEDFACAKSSPCTGKIFVALDPHYTSPFVAQTNILENLKQTVASPYLTPLTTIRYLIAALVAAITFFLGFIFFGRVVRTGIEAIGRNPLARRTIQFGMALNALLMLVMIGVGLVIAYLILIL